MFSKLRKNGKSEKPTHDAKLCGMPALKQMRSWKREACLAVKTKTAMLSPSERVHVNETDPPPYICDEPLQTGTVDLIITPNYKRPVSLESPTQSRDNGRPNCIDRLSTGNGQSVVFSGEKSPGTPHGIPEVDEDVDDETTVINSPWRISKGDSGYKSKDDGKTDSKTKQRRSRRRTNSGKRSATSGLLDIKQQRKASRESLSLSMRALTPKERESIQCLEDVLKNLPDGHESVDEVFDSESSEPDDNVTEFPCKKIDEDEEQAIDYGYASVNDVSRRFSVDSMESVGSIIDLVGNLSTSPSFETSPLYAVVDLSKKRRDITEVEDVIKATNDDVIISRNVVDYKSAVDGVSQHSFSAPDQTRPRTPDDVIANPEDVISHLDDVINSFTFHSEEEKEEKTELKSERKKEKKTKRGKPRDHESDGELNVSKREKRKSKDPEKEKERKERKKKRKEEKRAKKRKERSEENDKARRREENIARHVEEITSLTQDMIKAARREEPVYAQVRKPKHTMDMNENFGIPNETPEPPAPFRNPPTCELSDNRPESPERRPSFSKLHFTSTPVAASAGSRGKLDHTSLQEEDVETRKVAHPASKRPVSDSNQYTPIIQPVFSEVAAQRSSRLHVSESMLQDSSRNLKHTETRLSTGKSLQVDPKRKSAEEKAAEGLPKPASNFYRNPTPSRNQPRFGRPMSLNLSESSSDASLSGVNKSSIYAYASFRLERSEPKTGAKPGQKPRPFVITTVKKPIQLY